MENKGSLSTARSGQLLSCMLLLVVLLGLPFVVPGSRGWLLEQGKNVGNYGLFAVALLGLVLATWRFGLEGRQASAAERQAKAAQEQAEAAKQQAKVAEAQIDAADKQGETAKRQAEVATKVAEAAEAQAEAAGKHAKAALQRALMGDRALLHDRYQRAARMLGEKVQAVRIGGVYLLDRLAREHTEEYHLEVMRLYASFVRHQDNPPADDALAVDGRLRADVQVVMDFIGSRGEQQILCEKESGFVLDLRRANLQCADLRRANLESANLEEARLERANMQDALLAGARVKGTVLAAPGVAVIGLTQAQLDSCAGGPSEAPSGHELLGLEWRPDVAP